LPAVEPSGRREIVGTPTEENRSRGLRCADIVQSLCHAQPSQDDIEPSAICCTARAQILVN